MSDEVWVDLREVFRELDAGMFEMSQLDHSLPSIVYIYLRIVKGRLAKLARNTDWEHNMPEGA